GRCAWSAMARSYSVSSWRMRRFSAIDASWRAMANHSTAGAGALFPEAGSVRGGAVGSEVGAAVGDHVAVLLPERAGIVVGGTGGAATQRRKRQQGSGQGEDEGDHEQKQSLHGV